MHGNLKPTSVDTLETFRKFVNRATTSPIRQRRDRGAFRSTNRQHARQYRRWACLQRGQAIASAYYDEFDNRRLHLVVAAIGEAQTSKDCRREVVEGHFVKRRHRATEVTLSATERGWINGEVFRAPCLRASGKGVGISNRQ